MLLVTIGPSETAAIFGVLPAAARRPDRRRLAFRSVVIAGGVLIVFAIGGMKLLRLLQVGMPAFEGQKTARLRRILRTPCNGAQERRINTSPQQDRHGEPPSFATLNQICAVPGIPQRVTLSETWHKV
jgi:hypothetical protein